MFKKKNLSEILKVRAHKQEVTSVCYHEDSDIMFTGSSLGSIKAWSMDSGREIAELDGHNNAIMDLQVSNGNQKLKRICYTSRKDTECISSCYTSQ